MPKPPKAARRERATVPEDPREHAPAESTPGEAVRTDRHALLWALGFTALAVALRLIDLDGKSLWFDEALSISDALDPAQGFGSGFHPPLFYLVLKAWIRVFGDSAFSTRLTAVIPGALTVPAVYLLGRRLYGHRSGVLAALLIALASLHVEYSQEVRMYALATMFLTVSTLSLAEAMRAPAETSRRQWALVAGYVTAGALAVGTLYLSALVVGGTVLALLADWRRARPVVVRAAILALPALAVAAGAAFLLKYTRALGVAVDFAVSARGVNQTLFEDPLAQTVRLPIDLAAQLLPGPSLKWLVIARYQLIALVVFDALATFGLVVAARRRDATAFARVLPLACWLLPTLFTAYMVGAGQLRFYLPYAPFLFLGIAAGLGTLRPRVLAVVAAALLVPSALATWWYFDPGMDKQPWRAVATTIAREQRPGDVVIVTEPHLLLPFRRYYQRTPGVDLIGFPEGGTERITEQNLRIWLLPLARDARRVWFVRMTATASQSDPNGLAPQWLERNFNPVFRTTLRGYNGDVELRLFERRAVGPG